MRQQIASESVSVGETLSNDIQQIMSNNKENVTPFMKIFWEQQIEANQKGSMMYHPMIIRFCLSLAAKSAFVYDELRSSGILTLPSRWKSLRDCKNVI